MRHRPPRAVGEDQRLFLAAVFDHGHEFLASEARHGAPDLRELLLQLGRDLLERAIARNVVMRVVELLEVIDVDHHHRQIVALFARRAKGGVEDPLEIAAVGQSGEVVAVREFA